MATKTYSEKLKDPRWQKKRLEILNRDKFTCQFCEDTKSTLNVHHKYYLRGLDPWEYPNPSLITYCERCHKVVSDDKGETLDILYNFLSGYFTPFDIGYIYEMAFNMVQDETHKRLPLLSIIGSKLPLEDLQNLVKKIKRPTKLNKLG